MAKEREHWSSKFGFIMAAMGSAIGLGTLWKFPYVTGQNGGGAFVLIYLVCTLFLGIPLLVSELMIGRRAQLGPIGAFLNLSKQSRRWSIVGWLSVLTPLLILTYYNVVAGWGLNYLLLSLDNFYANRSPEQIEGVFPILYKSGGITLFFQMVFTALTALVVLQGIRKGIEYWARIMMIGLFAILVGLLIYSTTLSGFPAAVDYLLYPRFEKLTPSGVLQALGLAFFTLSLGQGVMITYGSYLKREDNIPQMAGIIGLADIVVSLLAGLMIFPIAFTFGQSPEAGVGLVFETLPLLFSQMPASLLLSTVFFVLFVFMALTSSISLVEVAVGTLVDQFGWTRRRSVWIVSAIAYLFGIPCALSGSGTLFGNWPQMYRGTYFETSDFMVSSWLIPIIALFTSLFAGWRLDFKVAREEFTLGSRLGFLFRGWHFAMKWLVPAVIILILLNEGGVVHVDSWFKK